MVPEDLDVIREQIRTYVGKSSFWVIVVSPKPLKAQSLLQILEDFVRRRKGSCFGWLSADAPREVPHFAAPGFEKLIDLVEGLGGAVEVPSLVPLKGSFFKGLAMQLMEKQGETTERWQLRVVSNYRDVNEDQWCLTRSQQFFCYFAFVRIRSSVRAISSLSVNCIDDVCESMGGRVKGFVLLEILVLLHRC